MTDDDREDRSTAVRTRGPELAVAGFLFAIALLVITDSLRVGIGWADDGPRAGYFPFYIGVLLALAGVITLIDTVRYEAHWQRSFATREQLARIAQVFVPTCLYVAAIYLIGIYLASAVFIGYFMRRHGNFGWPLVAGVALGVPLTLFMLFERWFLVSLPKGPIERMLGY